MEEILVPVSLGELYDKLTILQIKLEKITDNDKLNNVRREYDLIQKICESHPIDAQYWIDLLSINRSLWVIEDHIRIKELSSEYDEEFIRLARSVYYSNDKRSEIKKDINVKYVSLIIEEKSYEKYN